MQHYGAPTRLLDWTYSPFVAVRFAVAAGGKDAVLWCINNIWGHEAAIQIVGRREIVARNVDATRTDTSFLPLYMAAGKRKKFVFGENPFHLNERLIIQRGLFLCPGDVTATFVDNLKAMAGWDVPKNVIKLRLVMSAGEAAHFVARLREMNVDSAVLFPGLASFCRKTMKTSVVIASGERRDGLQCTTRMRDLVLNSSKDAAVVWMKRVLGAARETLPSLVVGLGSWICVRLLAGNAWPSC